MRSVTAEDADSVATLLAELGHPADEQPLGLMCLVRHAVLHAPGPVAYIMALVTSTGDRRRGVGQLFVAAAMDWAKRHRCVRLSVTSAERRSDAHAFYVACGLPYSGRRFTVAIPPDE